MKRVYSRFMMGLFLFASILFLIGLIWGWDEWNTFRKLEFSFFAFLLPYIGFTTKIEYYDDFMNLYSAWFKVKVNYEDVVRIYDAANPFGYWLKCFDDRERNFILAFPLEHKKLRVLFDTIKKANPDVQIDVWWYKKQPKKTILKTVLKVLIFSLIVIIADIAINFF